MNEKCNCQDCEALEIIMRLRFNLEKGGTVEEALDAAIKDSLYIPS